MVQARFPHNFEDPVCLTVLNLEVMLHRTEAVPHKQNRRYQTVPKNHHEWTATVKSRALNGTGCPYCSHNKILVGFNDLASQRPQIASEWSERNYPLKPDMVTVFANQKVWWRCSKGHEWNTLISTRSGGSGCPYCSGQLLLKGFNDFATTHPQLAQESR